MDDQRTNDELEAALADAASGRTDADTIKRLTGAVAASVREAGTMAVASGRWLAELVVDVAPRLPVRDLAALQEQYGGLSGAALAGELIRSASRASAAVGAVSGALVSAQHFAPPTWVAIPLELLVDTLVVAAIEIKLVAELHETYGRPVEGDGRMRTVALVQAWAEQRGVRPQDLLAPGALAGHLGKTTRDQLVRLVRRRVLRAMGRNLSMLAPLLAGAVAGAEVNRRSTRAVGEAVVRDLAAAAPRASVAPGPAA